MYRKSKYDALSMTEKKYKDVLNSSFGLGLTNRLAVTKELGLKSLKLKNSILMTRVLETVYDYPDVGPDFREQKMRERKKLNQVNVLRSVRFLSGLPSRGQRTQTNAGTCKARRGVRSNNLIKKRSAWRLRIFARRRRDGVEKQFFRRKLRLKFKSDLFFSVENLVKQKWAKSAYHLLVKN